ncbi:MAG: helix-turn-helix domain-containing protein [bacterium]|nr:helix-turn-helix domain-containing protein [bacterium]
MSDTNSKIPTGAEVKAMRIAAGMTQKECAERFGYQVVRSWQKKEETGPSARELTLGEWELLMLLAGQHPEFTLEPKT